MEEDSIRVPMQRLSKSSKMPLTKMRGIRLGRMTREQRRRMGVTWRESKRCGAKGIRVAFQAKAFILVGPENSGELITVFIAGSSTVSGLKVNGPIQWKAQIIWQTISIMTCGHVVQITCVYEVLLSMPFLTISENAAICSVLDPTRSRISSDLHASPVTKRHDEGCLSSSSSK